MSSVATTPPLTSPVPDPMTVKLCVSTGAIDTSQLRNAGVSSVIVAWICVGAVRTDSGAGQAQAKETPQPAVEKIAWSVLSNYEYAPRMKFPDGVTALNGRRVEITGYLYPTKETRDLKEFILMRDQGTCCYGAQAKYNHYLLVNVVRGPGVNYTRDPVTVVGTFVLNEKIDGDYIDGIYELKAEDHRKS